MSAVSPNRAVDPARVFRFARAQWRWALFAPVLMVLGTVLHEGAHALAVLVAGGTLHAVHLLPGLGEGGFTFGQVVHSTEEPGMTLVRVAPFLAAHLHALVGGLVALRIRGALGQVLFFTSVLLPLVDASMLYAGLALRSSRADLGVWASSPGPLLALLPLFAALCVLASRAFFRQWPSEAELSRQEFALLLGCTLALPWLRFLSGLTA